MKKLTIFFLLLVAICQYPFDTSAQTVTPNLGMTIPEFEPGTWGENIANDLLILDSAVGSGGTTDTTCPAGSMFSAIASGVPTCTPISVIAQNLTLTGEARPAQITSNQDNYAGCSVTSKTLCYVNTDASRNITGFTGGALGATFLVFNNGSFNTVLKNLTGSSAGNQLSINADITLGPNQGIILAYDATATKWRAASGVSGAGGQAADNDLTALAGLSSTGWPTRTATDTWTQRTFQGTTNRIAITNPDGVSGNPVWNVGSLVVQTDQSNTFSAGDQSLAAAASFTFPTATGAAPTNSGRCAYDSTANRLKCGFNGATVTLAVLSEIQPLNANLTSLSGITGSNNGLPIFTGVGTIIQAILPSCADSAGQHLNYDTTSHLWSCGTSSTGGLSGGTTGKYLIATGANTFDTSGNLSQTAGVVNASGGFTAGNVATNKISTDTSAVTGTKLLTFLNTAGLVGPCGTVIGNYSGGHVIRVVKVGSIVTCADGGAAGSGTWTDGSTNTGTNKALRDALAGGTGNAIWTPVRASWDGASLTTDGTICLDGVKTTINSGPAVYAVVWAHN